MLATMFRPLWRNARPAMLVMALLLVILPFQLLRSPAATNGEYDVYYLLQRAQIYGTFYQLSAVVVGLLAAVGCWLPDRTTRHVYALAIPIARWRYLALRFVAGLGLHLPLALVVLVAAKTAVSMTTLPLVLTAYPGALALRWLLGSWTVFAFVFMLQSLSRRAALWIAIGGITVVAVDMLLVGAGVTESPWLMDQAGNLLNMDLGPIGQFIVRWMMIDV